jgi:hypothetical protein
MSKNPPDSHRAGVTVIDNADRQRFEGWVDGSLRGFIVYQSSPGGLELLHTVVKRGFEGRGIGSQLAAAALDEVRARGITVVPTCSFIVDFIEQHPEYQDLVAVPVPEKNHGKGEEPIG